MQKKLFGVVCATITPMNTDGEIDLQSAQSLCSHLAENGIHGIYPNGTNGEALLLNEQERKQIAEVYARENRGRCSLYVQCGAATTRETYAHVRHAKEIGADGAGIMTPSFFPMDDAALFEYYDTILSELPDFPVYAYNISSRTGNDISPALLGRLMNAHENLMGIKNSSPDLARLYAYIHCAENRQADALIGSDLMAICCMSLGGKGWVSGPAAAMCKPHVALYDAIQEGDNLRAQNMVHHIWQIKQMMGKIPAIPATKYMLMRQGVIKNAYCRPPFRALSEKECSALDELLLWYDNLKV